MLRNKHKLLIIFFISVFVRSGILLISISVNGYENFINHIVLVPRNDTVTYNQLALNLIKHHSFTYIPGSPPVSLRTPGYPLFISIIYLFFGVNPLFVLIIQLVIDSLIIFLIYKLSILFLNHKISIIASFLYAIEPTASIQSLSMFSDTLFAFTIVLFAYLFVKFILKKENKYLILSGIVLGAANLIKPSGIFIPIIVCFILLFIYKNDFKNLISKILFFLLFYTLILSPWVVRNYIHFNKIFLSTAGEYNLLVLNVAPIKIFELKIKQNEAINKLLAEADSLMEVDGVRPMFNKKPSNYWEELTLQYDFNKSHYWKQLAIYYISNHTKEFIKFYLLGVFHSLVNLGTGTYSTYFALEKKINNFNIKEQKDIQSLLKKFIENKSMKEIILAILIGSYLLFVYAGLIIGIYNFKMIKSNYISLFLIILAFYFILIAGAGGLARFKLPSIPFYIIFSSIGLEIILKFLEERLKKN